MDTIRHVHHDQMRSIKIGCSSGLMTFTITLEGDLALSRDLTTDDDLIVAGICRTGLGSYVGNHCRFHFIYDTPGWHILKVPNLL